MSNTELIAEKEDFFEKKYRGIILAKIRADGYESYLCMTEFCSGLETKINRLIPVYPKETSSDRHLDNVEPLDVVEFSIVSKANYDMLLSRLRSGKSTKLK